MAVEEEDLAAAKVQAIIRGKKSRKDGAQILAAAQKGKLAEVERCLSKGIKPTPEALQASLELPDPSISKLLISCESAWGVDETPLSIWKTVQQALAPPNEDDEEAEEVDVEDEEWQKELAEKTYGEEDPDGIFEIQKVVKNGIYVGGRAPPAAELAFDTEVSAREGYGVSLLTKGDVYAGGYVAGKREGKGVYKYKDGSIYCGGWKADLKHGAGTMVYADKATYTGQWLYNKRHGKGVYVYANGDIFSGMWFTGAKHGAGKYISNATGTRFKGVWANGALQSSAVHSADGSSLFSSFSNGLPSGEGAFSLSSGVLATGTHEISAEGGEEEEEEDVAPKASRWTAASLEQADHASAAMAQSKFTAAAVSPAPRRLALLIGVEYAGEEGEPGAFPALDTQPALLQLKRVLQTGFAIDEQDVEVLGAGNQSKEAVLEALGALAERVGRGDAVMVGIICHGKKLLELDQEESPEELEEALCMVDEALQAEEIAELVAKFSERSAHLFLFLDSCFDAATLKEPPPNFCCISSDLSANVDSLPEGETRYGSYFKHNTTEWLATAVRDAKASQLTYGELFASIEASAAKDPRSELKQVPKLICRDSSEKVMQPM